MAVNRFDRIEAPDWSTEAFHQTPEGFLAGRACVTNIGVFRYMMADGSVVMELRHPDDVFHPDSLASLKLKPVTNDHPPVLLTAENIKEYQVGNVGDNPWPTDNIHLTVDMIIQDKTAVDDILSGKEELSCGYTCELVDESGVWLGIPYTKRQKNIRYNHVAVVDKARAGEAARIRLDSGDAIMLLDSPVAEVADDANNVGGEAMADLKTVKLDDGVEYSAEAQVIGAYTAVKAKCDSLQVELDAEKTAKSTIEAERDSLKDQLTASAQKISELEAARVDEAMIEARVNKRLAVLDAANKAKVEVKADMAEADIVKAVILAVFPEAKLDGRDEAYVSARFDCAVEAMAKEAEASVRVAGGSVTIATDSTENTAEAARAKALQARQDQWKLDN
jgi:hypothetical protein